MGTKERIKNALLYGGVGRDNYERVKPTIIKVNRIMLRITSIAATILIFIMLVCSYLVEEPGNGRIVHALALIVASSLCLLSSSVAIRNDWIVQPMVYLSYSVFYLYGILIGTIVDPHDKTVLFMVMLVFLPVVFVDRPLHIAVVSGCYLAIFIAACFLTKTGILLIGDVRNALTFGGLGIITGVIGDYHKIKGYFDQKRLKELNQKLAGAYSQMKEESRTDALTKMQNRNAYESDFYKMAKRCKESIGCVYIDVNGLKSTNDSLGHEAGDEMLKTVADSICQYFGDEFSYRIGGDEFVAFAVDPQFFEIKNRTDAFLAEIAEKGYYASVGWKIHDLDVLSMKELINSAETEMYKKKTDFYKQIGFDRRSKP